MKMHWLMAGGLAIALGWSAMGAAVMPAFAQDETQDESAEDEDVVVVVGKGRVDKGMKAFLDGDYAQAEIEFEKNLICAERQRMLEEMAIEQSVQSAIGVETGMQSPTGGWGDDGGIRIFDVPQNTYTGPTDPNDIPDRTCENSPWQLYMIGMSQIQLGKYDEAKRNFYKVINTTRNPLLFDAHFRIALLEILDGNVDKAEDRLKTLTVLQGRCVRQGERCEFRAEIDERVAYLDKALGEARSG